VQYLEVLEYSVVDIVLEAEYQLGSEPMNKEALISCTWCKEHTEMTLPCKPQDILLRKSKKTVATKASYLNRSQNRIR